MHTTQWQLSTEPNFITKPKPMQWEKVPIRQKPTKKPIDQQKRPASSTSLPTTLANIANIASTLTNKPKPPTVRLP